MIKNYLIIAMRNFWRHKVFSIINISGLSIGISAALVIFLIVSYEFSFEKFQKDGNRIYRVVSDATFPGGSEFKCSGVPMPMPVALRNDLPGIETASHFVTIYQAKATIPFTGSQSPAEFKKQKNIIYADEFYFSLFKYEWLAGSEQTALKDPFQVVITESKAKLYFGNIPASEVIGRQIIYNDSIKTMVSGIVKDLDDKATDFRFTEFISFPTMIKTGIDNQFGGEFWGSINSASQLFLKLEKGTAAKKIESQLPALRKKYNKEIREGKDDTYNHLQSLTDIHFNQDYDAFDQRQAHKPTMYGLLAVGAFLLLLGCINFINLTTARSALRAKEIGIRKTAGSSKMQLICQFLSETFVLTVMAAIFSLVLIPSLLKVFHDFIPPEINSASINQPPVWIFLSLLVLAITFLSGFYPALVLTKFQPVRVLKNQVYTGTSKNSQLWLRKSLTVTQFVIAQFLVIATLVVSKQVHYSLNKDLGYKKDAIVYFNTPRNFFSDKKDDRRFALLERLKSFPEIDKVSLAQSSPASESTGSATIKVNNGKEDVEINVEQKNGDPDYFDIYKMKLVAGKWPQKSDTLKEYLINETFARSLGFSKPGEAVGHFVDAGNTKVPIVGILADFHTKSTHVAIKPLTYSSDDQLSFTIHIALKPVGNDPDSWKRGLAKTEKAFKEIFPEADFNYTFFDENIAGFYKAERNISRLLTWASGLCIFISCLGLMGLAIYTTSTRTKEIGVRKILGASVRQIVLLLSKDFISLLLIAFFISLPVAWWAMHNWLQDFVYRTSLSWWIFAVSGAGMILIAMSILSIRTIKAATGNPVKSLRTE